MRCQVLVLSTMLGDNAGMKGQIKVQHLGFSIGGKDLLDDVTLQLFPGQFAGIVGPSGAGKSTLLKLLCGLRKPGRGKILLDDQVVSELKRSPSHIGYVPQDDIIHNSLSVDKVLYYAAALRLGNLDEKIREQRIDQVLRMLQLSERRKLKVKRLSGGQRKRVSIAVELLAQPRVLFLDEPTSGLDPGMEKDLMRNLRKLADPQQGQNAHSVVVTTHIMDNLDLLDQLWIVYSGRLVFSGPPEQARDFFRVTELRAIFDQLPKRKPASWAKSLRDWHAQHPLVQQTTVANTQMTTSKANSQQRTSAAENARSQATVETETQGKLNKQSALTQAKPDPSSDSIEAQLQALKDKMRSKDA